RRGAPARPGATCRRPMCSSISGATRGRTRLCRRTRSYFNSRLYSYMPSLRTYPSDSYSACARALSRAVCRTSRIAPVCRAYLCAASIRARATEAARGFRDEQIVEDPQPARGNRREARIQLRESQCFASFVPRDENHRFAQGQPLAQEFARRGEIGRAPIEHAIAVEQRRQRVEIIQGGLRDIERAGHAPFHPKVIS